jgi:hypothetical protein
MNKITRQIPTIKFHTFLLKIEVKYQSKEEKKICQAINNNSYLGLKK